MENINLLSSTPEEVANELIRVHMLNGLNVFDASKSALETISFTLWVGVYPAYHSKIKKTENYLKKLTV